MTGEPRDDLDRALAAGLSELAPDGNDADAVLTSMRPRLRRARTRHRVVRVSVVAVSLLTFAGVAGALGNHAGKSTVSVSHSHDHDRDDAHSTTTVHPATSTTAPNIPPNGNGTRDVAPTTIAPGTAPVPSHSGNTSGDGPLRSEHGPSSTTTVPPEQHTYVAAGGSVTIRYANGEIHIQSVSPTAGCDVERHDDGPDRVEVRFQNCPQESRIRVDLKDGQLVQESD